MVWASVTIQYNILLLQSQTDLCDGDIYKYNNKQATAMQDTVL